MSSSIQLLSRPYAPTGYGLMGLTWRQPHLLPSQSTAFEAMKESLAGLTSDTRIMWNAGQIYGSPERNSCHIIAEYFAKYPNDQEKVLLSIKAGIKAGTMTPDGSEAGVRQNVEDCITALSSQGGPPKSIDIFQCARADPNTPIEETVTALGKLVKEGKIGGIGLSEVKASTIERAVKIHPIAAVEVEVSLWSTDILRNGIAYVCAKHDIPIIAYSPLSRGALAGDVIRKNSDIPEGDMRKHMPRFQDDVLEHNNRLVDEVEAFAKKKGATKAQVAIAWVRQLSGRMLKITSPEGKEEEVKLGAVMPIPGATRAERVKENLGVVELTDGEWEELDKLSGELGVKGNRYPDQGMKLVEG